jgi:hypothetical protein
VSKLPLSEVNPLLSPPDEMPLLTSGPCRQEKFSGESYANGPSKSSATQVGITTLSPLRTSVISVGMTVCFEHSRIALKAWLTASSACRSPEDLQTSTQGTSGLDGHPYRPTTRKRRPCRRHRRSLTLEERTGHSSHADETKRENPASFRPNAGSLKWSVFA